MYNIYIMTTIRTIINTSEVPMFRVGTSGIVIKTRTETDTPSLDDSEEYSMMANTHDKPISKKPTSRTRTRIITSSSYDRDLLSDRLYSMASSAVSPIIRIRGSRGSRRSRGIQLLRSGFSSPALSYSESDHRPISISSIIPRYGPTFNHVSIPVYSDDDSDMLESGLHYDPFAQESVRNEVHNLFLDKWLYSDFSNLLKYLKISGGKVSVVKSKAERKKNKIEDVSSSDNEKKADFIEENILDKDRTRKIIMKIISETKLRWYNIPQNYSLVKRVIARHIKKKLKKMM
jgi:hypothetical protein